MKRLLPICVGMLFAAVIVFTGAHLATAIADTVTTVTPAPDSAVVTQTGNSIVVQYGNVVADVALFLLSVSGAFVAWIIRKLPAQWVNVILTARLDQALLKMIDFSLNTTAGAAKGKQVTIPVANDVIRNALVYGLQSIPAWLITWAGGTAGLTNKIIARLDLEPGAVAVPAPATITAAPVPAAAVQNSPMAPVPLMIVHQDTLKAAA